MGVIPFAEFLPRLLLFFILKLIFETNVSDEQC